jgi:hypothetical protein
MTWEITKNGGIERRFSIENSDDFNNLKRCIPQAQKLWILFNECKRLGGVLINQCSDLINDIRNQSEVKTRLAFGFQDYSQPDKVRLDRFFAWSVYADALNILPNPDLDRTYHFERIGLDTAEIYWGDLGLAVVKFSETNKIIRAHKQLKALNKKSSQTKKIIDVKQLLNDAEIRLIKELKLIRQHIIAV